MLKNILYEINYTNKGIKVRYKLITKKFQLNNEDEAKKLQESLDKINYQSIALGSAVVSKCRQTKKLEKVLVKFDHSEFIPSDYDVEKLDAHLLK